MDYSKLTLGELLSSENQAIKRNAVGILKQLQKGYYCIKCRKLLNAVNEITYCDGCAPEWYKKMREENRLTR